MSKGQHRRQGFDRVRGEASPWRVGAALVAVITLITSVMITTSASASEDPAPTTDQLVTTVSTDPASGGTVAPGGSVEVTLGLQNTASTDLPAGTTVASDLTAVAPLVTLPDEATLAAAGVSVAKTADKATLTWTVPGVAAGESASTKLKLTVGVDAGGQPLAFAAAPAGSACAAEACKTELTVAKAETVETTWSSESTTAPAATKTAESTEPAKSSAEPTETTADSSNSSTEATSEPTTASSESATEPTATSTGTSTEASTAESSTAPMTENGGSSISAAKSTPPASSSPKASSSEPSSSSPSARPRAQARAEADADAGVSPQLVPPATGNNAVITVKVGGNRLTTTSVGALAGVTLTLYDGDGAPTTPATGLGGSPTPNPNTCVSDSAGDCSWIIGNTQAATPGGPGAGPNNNRRFWIVQTGSPAGPPAYLQNSSLITGPDGGPFTATPYRFRTGTTLTAGATYSSGGSFMLGTGNNVPTASGGIWQASRVNPVAPTKCGLNVALILDVSGSVAGSLPALKTAATTFTNSLVGTPSQLALFTFAATAPAPGANNVNRPLTPVSTQAGANTVNAWINGVTAGGTTNWDRGIFQVQQSTAQFDIAVVITDGNPTVYGNQEGPGNYTRFREVENGIFSANAVKNENTRVLAFGVGAGIAAGGANLAAISGPTLGSDYFQTSNFSQVGTILRNLALGTCTGSVTVIKQVVPSSAPAGSITGAAPAGGWTFGATTSTSGVTIAPASGATAVGTGALNFNLTFPGGTETAPVAVTETQQPGFTLVPVGGFNAVCTRPDTGASVPVTNTGALGFTVASDIAFGVTCTVYNRAPNPPAEIVVNKQWAITDTTSGTTTTYANGTQPSDLQAALTLGGTTQPFGVTRTGFAQGDTVAIAETVTNGLRGCTLGTATISRTQPAPPPTNVGVPYTATLAAGTNSFLLTNPVTCTTRLTLVKSVSAGPALPTAWSLSATAPAGSAPGPVGTTGVSAVVTPNARYALAESGGDPRYIQRAGANAVPIPGSTVSWQCVEIDGNGNEVPGFADGLNGGVIVFIGLSVRCTAVNDTAQLILVKNVTNNNGGTALPGDFSLSATPSGTVFPGLPTPPPVAGSTTGATIWVRPGQTYSLAETGPPGYTQTDLSCVSEDGITTRDAQVSVPVNTTTTCTFVNDDVAPRLTLKKQVSDLDGNLTYSADWTLTATGSNSTTPIDSKPTVAADGVSALVTAGITYNLTESDGLAGYTNGTTWACTGGGTFTSPNQIVLAPGENATCTIVNALAFIPLTVDKTVSATFDRLYLWTIAKDVGQTSVTTTPGGNAIFHYTVTVSPNGTQDSNWAMTGTITIANPNPVEVPVTVTDVTAGVGGGASCTVAGASATVPANSSGTFNYSCTFTSQPTYTGGTNTASATWTRNGGGSASSTAKPVTFGVDEETNLDIHVQDNKTTDTFVDLGTANYFSAPKSFEYDLTLVAGDLGECNTYTNTAQIQETEQQAQQTVNVCVPNVTLSKEVGVVRGGTLVGGTGTTVLPGDVLTWTITAHNTSTVAYTGDLFTDDLTSTVAGVTLAGAPDFTSSDPSVATTWAAGTNTLSATATNLAAGASVTVTYSGTVKSREELTAGGVTTIDNTVVPGDDVPNCTTTPGCDTTNPVTPHLTLVKVVDNGDSGQNHTAADWTLTATGPVTATGPGAGAGAVTGTPVPVGTYTLSESGPGSYHASDWSCTGAASVDAAAGTVTLANGNDATCTITNTALERAEIVKDFDSATQNPGTGIWTVTYTLTVTNPNADDPVTYDLSDAIGYPTGVTINSVTVTGPAGASINPAFDGNADQVITTGRNLAGGASESYTLVVTAEVPDTVPVSVRACQEGPGAGFYNNGTVTTFGLTDTDDACGNIPPLPIPTVLKTVTSTTQQTDGSWTIVYDLAVTNGNPTYVTFYNLTDALQYGGGITINSASVAGVGGLTTNAAWDGDGDTNVLPSALPRLLGPASTDHYTVTANATVTAESSTVDRDCTSEEGDNGTGFLNTATVSILDQSSDSSACAEPVSPVLTKTPVSVVANSDGSSYDITYNVTVKNPSPDTGLVYTLGDTPQYDASIAVNSAEVTASSDGSGSVPGVLNNWDGTTLAIVSARALAASGTDTFTIVVNATAPADLPPTIAECSDGQPEHGFYNLATAESGEDTFTADACLPVPGGTPHWTLVKSSNPKSGSSVDVGATITYTLTATNDSTVPVTGAEATDTLPAGVTLVTPLPSGVTDNDGVLTWAIPDIAPLTSVKVSYKVTVDSDAAGKTLKNVAVPTTPNGNCTEANDCTTTHKVKQLIVKVADSCKLDAAYLSFTISSKNVPNAAKLPVTATWKLPDGTVVRTDTIPAGQLTGELLWPGMVLNADGIAIGWPGWRELQQSDFPLQSTDVVYGTQIEDDSLPSQAYRLPLTVTFEMNPSETVTVTYPGQTPNGCVVPREPDLKITKTATVSAAAAGQTFDYNINVKNASTLAVAYPVTLSDPIPATLKVTGIGIEATALPHWENCGVSGFDADGYGGTLTCELSGALGVGASAPQVTLTVVVASTLPTSSISNTATTCWQNPSLPAEAQKCASDTVVVSLPPPLPNTGVPAAQMGLLALILMVGGGLVLTGERVWRRRPRRH